MRLLCFTCYFIFCHTLLSQDFNILSYGAIPDCKTLNSAAIQSAIDAANQNGGGRVVIPAGSFLSGSIIMKSGVEMHLDKNATLLGSTNPEHYSKLKRWTALIMADNQTNISITGPGEIDGQGRKLALHIDSLFYAGKIDSAFYNFVEMRPSHYIRPQILEFMQCKNITIKNVSLKNAACWVQTYDQCHNIILDNVRVESDAYWNNDGIDIQDSHNVRVTNCNINSADDGICLKSESTEHYCDSIYIANCAVRSSASAIKLGTASMGGFKNVTIENIKVYDTFRSAIAIECVDGGILENIMVNNVHAVNTGNAIFIRLGERKKWRPAGTLKNITIKNIKVDVAFERPDYKYDIRGPALPFFHNIFPSSITGIPGHLVEHVTLENIEINYPGRGNNGLANMPLSRLDDVPEKEAAYPEFSMFGELPAWGFYVRHMDGLTMKNIKLNLGSPDYRPAFVFDDVLNLDIQSLSIKGETKPEHIILHKTVNVKIDKDLNVIKM
ncbi:MAG TPA: glycosyl hydrolase family 28 protein [Saprospiraceae bacterium]|nr:glycosyl hydrolase family 28 protein [Saprospiraceae bacterium]